MTAGVGCGDNLGVPDDNPNFQLTVSGDRSELTVSGVHHWFQNAVAEADYESWWTKYDDSKWSVYEAPVEVSLREAPENWLAGDLTLDDEHRLEFVDLSFGFGWRAIYPAYGDVRNFDLEQLELAPEAGADDRVDAGQDFANCEVEDTRILVALSKYPGTMDELWAAAQNSAAAQELPAPADFHEMILDPAMYEMLFGLHKTMVLEQTTFAFISLQIDPQCGDLRLAYRTERDLIGPVERIER